MEGLKTENIKMNMPYTDFIKSTLSKLNDIEKAEYSRDALGYKS